MNQELRLKTMKNFFGGTKILAFVVSFFIVSLFMLQGVHAEDTALGVSIAPLKWQIKAEKGTVLQEHVTAINPNNFPLKVVPEFQDFRVLENAGIQWIPSDVENPYRMTDWISIAEDPIEIPPGESVDVPFTITVPDNASVGGHYAAIFFRAVVDNTGSTIGSVPRVGALIIFEVNGKVKKGGEISLFSGPRFVEKGPVQFDLSVKNTGTTHYEPNVSVDINNIIGPRTEISAEKDRLIYPGVSRSLKTMWTKKYPIGYFTATAHFIDGEGVEHASKIWFVGFPWRYALVILLVLILFRALYKYGKRHLKFVAAPEIPTTPSTPAANASHS